MRRPRTRTATCGTITCLPPWFLLWRWLNGGDSKSKGGSRDCEAASSSSPGNDDFSAGETGKGVSFNLGVGVGVGVGFGLIYFVRDELNKMIELRQNIELLLEELRNQDTKSLSGSGISSSASNAGVRETEENDHGERPETRFSSGRYRRERSFRMDQLEAELEAEFDRLKITSDSFKYSRQQYSEVTVEDSAPESSINVRHMEDDYVAQDEFYGVSPRELERKLHEVLETRQQERIAELESALDYAMQQLEKRERELARLTSRCSPAVAAGLLTQVKQDHVRCVEPEFESMKAGKSLVKIE